MPRKKTPDVMGEVLGKAKQPPSESQNTEVDVEPRVGPTETEKAPDRTGDSASKTAAVSHERGTEGMEKDEKALSIINENVVWSMGVGLIPIPMVDIVAVSGLQLKMVNDLAEHYGVRFSANIGKSIIASLVGGFGAESIARGSFGSLVKSIPLVGSVVGWFTLSMVAGASTYATGKVFMQHFESGGTFLDFEAENFKETFSEQYGKGLKVAADMKSKVWKKKPEPAAENR